MLILPEEHNIQCTFTCLTLAQLSLVFSIWTAVYLLNSKYYSFNIFNKINITFMYYHLAENNSYISINKVSTGWHFSRSHFMCHPTSQFLLAAGLVFMRFSVWGYLRLKHSCLLSLWLRVHIHGVRRLILYTSDKKIHKTELLVSQENTL